MITLQNNGIREKPNGTLESREQLNNKISFLQTAEYEPGVF